MLTFIVSMFLFLLGLAGALVASYGAWLAYMPAGYLFAGFFLMLMSYMYSRQIAAANNIKLMHKNPQKQEAS